MERFLIWIIIGLFGGLLFLNIYFRAKVFKAYKQLVRAGVEFKSNVVFDQKVLEQEVLTKYPQHSETIQLFADNLRKSIRLATVLIILITLFGAVLMFYR